MSKLDDGTMQSIDYKRDIVSLEHLPKSNVSTATNPQTNTGGSTMLQNLPH